MGLLINGEWKDQWYDTKNNDGEFKREAAQLRNWITKDGSAGPSGQSGFKAESGRYHLYVSLACPWAHRTLIFRQLKGLQEHISVSVVSPDMLNEGWTFNKEEGSTGDTLYHKSFLHEIYTLNNTTYSGRVTVPILWDKVQQKIVSNESSEIIRMFNSEFNELTRNIADYYPVHLHTQIEQWNELIYEDINNGVYRCGFATSQSAYENAYQRLFAALEKVEKALASSRYLCGHELTEADWRLFTTLIRFDSVYHGHFKCNLKRLEDFLNISEYIRDLYQEPGVAQTVDFYHIKRHYYFSHTMINPTQVVPLGPEIDYARAHNRALLER